MHLVRTEAIVRLGGNGEFEAQIAKFGDARKGQPGYLGQTLLHSYSRPNKYTITSRYESIEAVWAFLQSDVFVTWVQGIPSGLFTVTNQEVYEGVLDVDAANMQPSAATCEVLADWTVQLGAAADFESSRRELAEIRKQHMPGFVSNRLRRSAGTPGRYLLLGIYTTGEAARAGQALPEVQAFGRAHPATAYGTTPPAIEAYQVVHRMQVIDAVRQINGGAVMLVWRAIGMSKAAYRGAVLAVALLVAGLLGACAGGSPTAAAPSASSAAPPPAADQPALPPAQPGEERVFRIVPQQSKASYLAQEKWLNWPAPTKAVANTNDVEGEFALVMGDQLKLAANHFRVDMRTLVSEVADTPMSRFSTPPALILSVRDGVVRSRLESGTYPFAEFTATGVEGLPARYAESQAIELNVQGNLTIHDVTLPVVFSTEATVRGDTLIGTATTDILMTDFGVEPPSIGATTVENAMTIAVQLTAKVSAVQTPSGTLEDRNPKLASELVALLGIARDRGSDAALQDARERGFYVADDSVRVIVESPAKELAAPRGAITASGGQIEFEDVTPGRALFQVLAPISAIEEIAARPEVLAVHATFREETGSLGY